MVYNKHLFLRFFVHDPDTVTTLHDNFRAQYPAYGDTIGVFPNPEDTNGKIVIFQISHNGDDEHWENGLKLCMEAALPNSPLVQDLGIDHSLAEFASVEAMGDGFTQEERFLLSYVGNLTGDLKSVILTLLSEIQQYDSQVRDLERELTSVKAHSLNNATNVAHTIQAIRNLTEKLGVDEDDVFPPQFTTIQ